MRGWGIVGLAVQVWTIDDRTTSSPRGRISVRRIEGPSAPPSICLAILPSPPISGRWHSQPARNSCRARGRPSTYFELDALAELYYSLISCVRACVRAYVSDCIWQPQLLWLC